MPELPEVETVRRSLIPHVLNSPIKEVEIIADNIIRRGDLNLSSSDFEKKLLARSIEGVNRRAKLLSFALSDGMHMLAHLKMTGQFMYLNEEMLANGEGVGGGHSLTPNDTVLPHKHTRAIFSFENGGKLYFNDMRLFAYLKIIDSKALKEIHGSYGIEPGLPDFTLENFQSLFGKSKRNLKAFLLDQSQVAGLGNIYVDEVCHYAEVLPTRTLDSLKKSEIKKLYEGCQNIIPRAIENCGTTFQYFKMLSNGKIKSGNFSQFLQVFKREGQACLRCGEDSLIQKIRCAGRGTHFCAHCQW